MIVVPKNKIHPTGNSPQPRKIATLCKNGVQPKSSIQTRLINSIQLVVSFWGRELRKRLPLPPRPGCVPPFSRSRRAEAKGPWRRWRAQSRARPRGRSRRSSALASVGVRGRRRFEAKRKTRRTGGPLARSSREVRIRVPIFLYSILGPSPHYWGT